MSIRMPMAPYISDEKFTSIAQVVLDLQENGNNAAKSRVRQISGTTHAIIQRI